MERWATGSALQTVGALINVVVFTIFGMLGGLLGVAVFKKNAPPPASARGYGGGAAAGIGSA